MAPDRDDREHGLWRNIECIRTVTDWSLTEIADQTHYYAPGVTRQKMRHALTLVIDRRQLRWKYSAALAKAWGVREIALLHEDFTRCATLAKLRKEYGFDMHETIQRWAANRDAQSGNLRLDRLSAWLADTIKKGDDDKPE
jgi:hypothetical protein